jgi:hypothetical protein
VHDLSEVVVHDRDACATGSAGSRAAFWGRMLGVHTRSRLEPKRSTPIPDRRLEDALPRPRSGRARIL